MLCLGLCLSRVQISFVFIFHSDDKDFRKFIFHFFAQDFFCSLGFCVTSFITTFSVPFQFFCYFRIFEGFMQLSLFAFRVLWFPLALYDFLCFRVSLCLGLVLLLSFIDPVLSAGFRHHLMEFIF
jgi:hypothetical protein